MSDILMLLEDSDKLHDKVLDLFDISLTDDKLKSLIKKLPTHIFYEACRWGLSDTVVSDNIYVWLQKNPNVIEEI